MPTTTSVLELWQHYQDTRDEHTRELLILALTPLVRHAIGLARTRYASDVVPFNLASRGLVALIGSIDAYQPSAGESLEQFARTRVLTAISDAIRSTAHVHSPRPPRSVERRPAERARRSRTRGAARKAS